MYGISASPAIKTIARLGFTAKGLVYSLIGILAFMAAFELGRQSSNNIDKETTFNFIEDLPGGKWLLAIVTLGICCYVVWRVVQALLPNHSNDSTTKNIFKKVRYLFSALVYLSLAFFAGKMVFQSGQSSGDKKQDAIQSVMQMNNGPLLIGIGAIIIAIIGIYQIYYSFSEKYEKHVSLNYGNDKTSDLLLTSGKIGYVARGIVWLIIGWLFGQAALHSNSSEAGDTAKAFQFLEEASYGSYLLGAVGFGLLCYGIFNFIRARYESFQ